MSDRLDPARLDELWDFTAPDVSVKRFRAELADASPVTAAELATQLARALGLAGRGDEADAVLDAIDEAAPVVTVRIALERGRRLNSSGSPEAAVPFFARARDSALAAREDYLAVDALHMLAIAEPSRAVAHTEQALEIVAATNEKRTRRWGIALHNNLGWIHHDTERFDAALAEFERADAAARAYGSTDQQQIAQWSIARCYRSLGRTAEALAIQERLLVERPDDEYVHEELAALRDT